MCKIRKWATCLFGLALLILLGAFYLAYPTLFHSVEHEPLKIGPTPRYDELVQKEVLTEAERQELECETARRDAMIDEAYKKWLEERK